ncbi:MAG TPA: MotA/TolQ/ExbB proton channel family protein [Thermoanaerobaculia bacterium]|jgi:biopolymer transport protein ExbB/biopolymer transport protein TolQ|nr:MotA/TolQ/ExbB proton channel family protein [Thermoanaerobaculia bacterium]
MEGMQASFSMLGMWQSMNWVAKGVVIVLAMMSVWSLTIAIERLWRFQHAKKQSLRLAREVTPLLKQHKLDEAINLARKKDFRHSHLARVLSAGLTEFQYETAQQLPEDFDLVASGQRAIERETLMTTAEMKKGLGNLATISTTAPFVGLFGTVAGIIHAFQGMALSGSGGLGAVSAGIAEALVTTAFGLFVAIPAVWLYNYFLQKIERFQVEMSNSSSQLIDYFIKNEARARAGATRQAAARA